MYGYFEREGGYKLRNVIKKRSRNRRYRLTSSFLNFQIFLANPNPIYNFLNWTTRHCTTPHYLMTGNSKVTRGHSLNRTKLATKSKQTSIVITLQRWNVRNQFRVVVPNPDYSSGRVQTGSNPRSTPPQAESKKCQRVCSKPSGQTCLSCSSLVVSTEREKKTNKQKLIIFVEKKREESIK